MIWVRVRVTFTLRLKKSRSLDGNARKHITLSYESVTDDHDVESWVLGRSLAQCGRAGVPCTEAPFCILGDFGNLQTLRVDIGDLKTKCR